MAERISSLSPRRVGRPALYPWSEWTDGSVWRIARGVDFSVAPSGMVKNLYSRAFRQGLSVEARIVDGDTVEFQFSPQQEEAA